MSINPPTILIDSREQLRWKFTDINTETVALQTGDYSVRGMEHLVTIERKSLSDLFGTLSLAKGNQDHWNRFRRELERMRDYKYKFLVIESIPSRIWKGTRYSKMSPSSIMSQLVSISIEFDIHILFTENRTQSQNYVKRIVEKLWRKHNGVKSLFD